MIQAKLNELKQRILDYASLIEMMIEKSIEGLLNSDFDTLKQVINELEPQANEYEIEIDEKCISFIAQYQPKAGDLRTVAMIFKMNNDLERMGDLAVNIAESSEFLISRPSVKPLIDIPNMAREATYMLRDAIKAFIDQDVKLAKSVCDRDDIIDNLKDQILRELITYMVSDSKIIPQAIHLIRISRSIERIADLTTNICEDVIFIAEGTIIKHHKNIDDNSKMDETL